MSDDFICEHIPVSMLRDDMARILRNVENNGHFYIACRHNHQVAAVVPLPELARIVDAQIIARQRDRPTLILAPGAAAPGPGDAGPTPDAAVPRAPEHGPNDAEQGNMVSRYRARLARRRQKRRAARELTERVNRLAETWQTRQR